MEDHLVRDGFTAVRGLLPRLIVIPIPSVHRSGLKSARLERAKQEYTQQTELKSPTGQSQQKDAPLGTPRSASGVQLTRLYHLDAGGGT